MAEAKFPLRKKLLAERLSATPRQAAHKKAAKTGPREKWSGFGRADPAGGCRLPQTGPYPKHFLLIAQMLPAPPVAVR